MVYRMTNDPEGERILRAKYLDWCSAKVADYFLGLTPDQIYELAHPGPELGTGGGDPDAGTHFTTPPAALAPTASPGLADPVGTVERDANYLALAKRVAEVLAQRLRLPAFEEWAEAYRRTPALFDEELLGLWRG